MIKYTDRRQDCLGHYISQLPTLLKSMGYLLTDCCGSDPIKSLVYFQNGILFDQILLVT